MAKTIAKFQLKKSRF